MHKGSRQKVPLSLFVRSRFVKKCHNFFIELGAWAHHYTLPSSFQQHKKNLVLGVLLSSPRKPPFFSPFWCGDCGSRAPEIRREEELFGSFFSALRKQGPSSFIVLFSQTPRAVFMISFFGKCVLANMGRGEENEREIGSRGRSATAWGSSSHLVASRSFAEKI